ncbi:MAG: HPP family protein [Thermodesulfobacteriota bacterium]
MKTKAKDVMEKDFHTLSPQTTLSEAIKRFQNASEVENKRIFGMMVTDDSNNLVGMLSMYDVLLFLRPKHIDIWGEMEDIIPEEVFYASLKRLKALQVGDLMTTEVISISPDTNLLMVMEIMVKYHIRRIPVIENEKNIVGIVYISDVFYHLLKKCQS